MSPRRLLPVLAALLLGLLLSNGAWTLALLSDEDRVDAGAFSTGSIVPPNPPEVRAVLGLGTISWTPTTVDTGAGAQPVSGYEVYRYADATGGTGTLVCTTTTQTSCPPAPGLSGFYAVRAVLSGTSWTAESTRTAPSLLGDTTRPTITHVAPVGGESGRFNDVRNPIRNACGDSAVACGTTSDDVGVTEVTYTLQRGTGAAGLTLRCWTGMSWDPAPVTGCAARPATMTSSGGITRWGVPGSTNTAYPNTAGGFTLTITARDAAGNARTSQIRYTIVP